VAKVLQIGNYPPPACGWAVQTELIVKEIRRRGHVCEVLNINENRKTKSNEYVDVQNGFDYLQKVVRFAARGYQFQVHVNGQSVKGYLLAVLAAAVGRMTGRPVALSWRGGLHQKYFPCDNSRRLRWAYRQLFRLSNQISCNSLPIKRAIENYGIASHRVSAIPAFSTQHLDFEPAQLHADVESFLRRRWVFFCYVSFRPEYRLPVLREAMRRFREAYPEAGFVWLGFPGKEMTAVRSFVADWSQSEQNGLLLLGNLPHSTFLTLLTRCAAYVRMPVCDGVASSILESLALGVPVIASENGSRPARVTTFEDRNATDLASKLAFVVENYAQVKEQTRLVSTEDNIARTVDWLLEGVTATPALQQRRAHAR
jgi:glycosyltransferase involved in cell wall biosynthesis